MHQHETRIGGDEEFGDVAVRHRLGRIRHQAAAGSGVRHDLEHRVDTVIETHRAEVVVRRRMIADLRNLDGATEQDPRTLCNHAIGILVRLIRNECERRRDKPFLARQECIAETRVLGTVGEEAQREEAPELGGAQATCEDDLSVVHAEDVVGLEIAAAGHERARVIHLQAVLAEGEIERTRGGELVQRQPALHLVVRFGLASGEKAAVTEQQERG